MTKETLCRSITKATIWRIIALITTFSIAYGIHNDINSSIKLSIIDNAVSFSLYFIYERSFSHIKWGYID